MSPATVKAMPRIASWAMDSVCCRAAGRGLIAQDGIMGYKLLNETEFYEEMG